MAARTSDRDLPIGSEDTGRWQPGLALSGLFGVGLDGILWVVVVVLLALPLGLVLVQSLMPDLFALNDATPAISLDAFAHLAGSPRLATGIGNSVLLGLGAAAAATGLGVALAVLVELWKVPLTAFWQALPWLVFVLPSYFKGLGWVLLMSPRGYLVQLGLLSPELAHRFFGLLGLILVEMLALFPVPYFIARARLSGMGGELIDAARVAAPTWWPIVRRVVLPLLLPAIFLGLMTTFAEVVGDFGMATTIARSMNFGLLTYNIYNALSQYPVDFAAAAAQSVLLALLVALALGSGAIITRGRNVAFVTGRSKGLTPIPLGRAAVPVTLLLAALTIAAALLPLAAIAIRALTRTLADGPTIANLDLAAIGATLTPGTSSFAALMATARYASIAALATAGFGLIFVFRVHRQPSAAKAASLGLAVVTVTLPGIILAFGYILLYARVPGFRDLPLYGTSTLLIIAYSASALPYALFFIGPALDRLGGSLEAASRLAGVSSARHLRGIVLPLVRRSIEITFCVTLIRAAFELPLSRMLIPIDGPPLPVLIVDSFTQDRDGQACALALVAMAALGLFWLIAGRLLRGIEPMNRGAGS